MCSAFWGGGGGGDLMEIRASGLQNFLFYRVMFKCFSPVIVLVQNTETFDDL